MTDGPSPLAATLRRYLTAMAVGNLMWEVAHVPLYTIWLTATPSAIAFAVLHCTLGDMLIAAGMLGLAIATVGRGWPARRFGKVVAVTIALAVTYTVFSEWRNIAGGAWAYREIMPTLSPFGTGLTPLLQWIVLPALAFVWARRAEGITRRHGK